MGWPQTTWVIGRRSNFSLFSDFQGVVNLNTHVTHGRFEWECPSNNWTARRLSVRL